MTKVAVDWVSNRPKNNSHPGDGDQLNYCYLQKVVDCPRDRDSPKDCDPHRYSDHSGDAKRPAKR